MTDKKIVSTIRNWFSDAKTANSVLESEQSITEWLDRMRWHVETYGNRTPVDEGYLYDWYIASVSEDDTPVWTEEHIDELMEDFECYPKRAAVEALRGDKE